MGRLKRQKRFEGPFEKRATLDAKIMPSSSPSGASKRRARGLRANDPAACGVCGLPLVSRRGGLSCPVHGGGGATSAG